MNAKGSAVCVPKCACASVSVNVLQAIHVGVATPAETRFLARLPGVYLHVPPQSKRVQRAFRALGSIRQYATPYSCAQRRDDREAPVLATSKGRSLHAINHLAITDHRDQTCGNATRERAGDKHRLLVLFFAFFGQT